MLIFEADEGFFESGGDGTRKHEKLSPELPLRCTFSIDLRLQRPFVMRCDIAAKGVDEKKSRHREYQREDHEKRSLRLHGPPELIMATRGSPSGRRSFLDLLFEQIGMMFARDIRMRAQTRF